MEPGITWDSKQHQYCSKLQPGLIVAGTRPSVGHLKVILECEGLKRVDEELKFN